ncbi:50S ribosomal protein L37ae [Candidatus Woesearchaeota archaeon]|nr:50S ribosomal protein L37ae [Candidatus Woesearchaeota archaeon]
MAIKEKLGSIRRFGARYGRKTKDKFGKIEKEQRKLHKCPFCSHVKVKRVALGIWQCRKCNSKFAGKAYTIDKKISFDEGEMPAVAAETGEEGREE